MNRLLVLALVALSAMAQDYRKPPATDWPLVGGDWGNTRYSTLARITASNVKTLKGAWMARLQSGFGAGFSQQGTPVVKDGVMYVTTGEQEIFALNAKTGDLIWEYRTPTDPKTGDNKAKRGVALGEGMVFGVESDIRQPAPKEGRAERHFGRLNSARMSPKNCASMWQSRRCTTRAWCTSAFPVATGVCVAA